MKAITGLILVVQPAGANGRSGKTWRYHYSRQVDGKQVRRRVPLGSYPAVSLADARRAYLELQKRVEEVATR